MTEQERATLPRLLGFKDLVYLTVGGVIGSGIFIVPASVLQLTGAQLGPALLVWIAGGVLSTLGAFTYAELGAMKPECGGLYIYIRDAFGGFVAFLYGWAMFFVISSATNATLAVAFASYLSELIPLSPWAARGVAVAMLAAITVINVIGTRQSADVQNWTTLLKVAAILIMSVLLLARGDGLAAADVLPSSLNVSMLSAMGAAMIGVLWAYEGWHYTTFAAGNLIAVFTIISLAASISAMVLAGPRVYFAMARDGVFVRAAGRVHPRFRTPAAAIIAQAIWSSVLVLSGTLSQLVNYTGFAVVLFSGIAVCALFVLRQRDAGAPRPFSALGYPWAPAIFVIASAIMLANAFWREPRPTLAGVAVILVGVPVYYLFKSGRGGAARRA
jgi:APA family basic amino acid/polyamine antiporter